MKLKNRPHCAAGLSIPHVFSADLIKHFLYIPRVVDFIQFSVDVDKSEVQWVVSHIKQHAPHAHYKS